MLNHNYSYYAFSIAFVLGATAVQFCGTLINARLLLIIISVIFLLLVNLLLLNSLYINKLRASKGSLLIPIVGFCAGFNWVALQAEQQLVHQFPKELERQKVMLIGQIHGLPAYKHDKVTFDFYVKELSYGNKGDGNKGIENIGIEINRGGNKVRLKNFKVRLSCYRCVLDIRPAQNWQLMVKLKKPHGFASWGAFDYEKYLFRHNIIARGYIRNSESNKLIESSGRMVGFQKIHTARYYLSDHITTLLVAMPNSAATIKALLIGDKSAMSGKQFEVLQRTGLSHLFAISGLHIGLIFLLTRLLSAYLLMPFSFLFIHQPKQQIQNILALLFAFFYSALAGFAIPTQRALIMLFIYVLLRLFSLNASLGQILLMAATLIILLDANAVMDIGFWLSFSAVLVIIVSMRNISHTNLISLQPRLWLGMLPLIMLFFHEVSFISPVLNLFVIPIFTFFLIPALMFCLLCLLVGFRPLADFLFIKIAVLLEYGWLWLEQLSQLSFSQLSLAAISPSALFLLMLIIIIFIQINKLPARYCLLLLLPTILAAPVNRLDDKSFSVAMLDVGQGLSMVVQTQNHALVYDTGAKFSDDFNTADAVLVPYLRQQNIHYLDTIIISHADNDHAGGYDVLHKQFVARQILSSRPDKVAASKQCFTGQVWRSDQVTFEIISPEPITPQSSNNHSCVLKISSPYGSVLITGDIERETEAFMLHNIRHKLSSNLMLIPHHGSLTSSTNDFINAVMPELAIVSVGYLNRYGHPNKTIMKRYKERGISVLNNVSSGSIRIDFTKQGMKINEYRKQKHKFW